MRSRFVIPISVVLGLVLSGSAASAADCSPPAWLKTVDVKQSTADVVGAGKGSTIDLARREARRAAASRLVKTRVNDILALKAVKESVNRKVYTKEDLFKATVLATAFNIKTPKKIAEATVCNVVYVALSANVKTVLTQLKQNLALGDEINDALTGKIDEREDDEADKAQPETVRSVAKPELTQKRLLAAAAAIGSDDLITAQLQRAMKRRAEKLASGIEQAEAAKAAEQRNQAIDRLEDEAREDEKFVAAAKELSRKNYVALFEMMNPWASNGDEIAQFIIGYMYGEALGVKRDDQESLQWLKRSASKNFGPAKALVGVMIYSGRGTKANPKEAMQWLDSAQADGWKCELALAQCSR